MRVARPSWLAAAIARSTTPGSDALRDVHERLSRTLAVLNEARTKAILLEMRRARDQA